MTCLDRESCEENLCVQPSTMQMKGFLPTWEVTWLESQEKEVELVEKTLQPTQRHWNTLPV